MDGMDEIVHEFLVESHENLDQLDLDLVALERDPTSQPLLASVFRTIHTIKGTSGFLAFSHLERLTHAGEGLLSRLRDGELALTPELTSLLLELVDTVRALLLRIETTGEEGAADNAALIDRLATYGTAAGAQADAPPEAAPAGAAAAAPSPLTPPSPWSAADDAPAAEPRRLGERLVDEGLVAPDDVTLAVLEQDAGDARRIGEILVEHGAVDATTLHEVLDAPDARRSVADATVRVDVAVLDDLMRLVGELLLTRNQIAAAIPALGDLAVTRAWQRLTAITGDLQDGVIAARMQPIDSVWNKLPRMTRDLSRAMGKRVRLELIGGETELDRSVLEAVKDPITHLVRNALDHGIETPEARLAAGKPLEGRLTLRAVHEAGQMHLEITDDGAGIDPALIARAAVDAGLLTERQASTMSTAELTQCVFLPGLSTAREVTNVSGRGVGMDVVKTNLERIGGSIDVESAPGVGTTFRVKIPLTLAIVAALVVADGADRYAVPQTNVLELVRVEAADRAARIEWIGGAPVYRLRGELLPLVSLRDVLAGGSGGNAGSLAADATGDVRIVVVGSAERRFGLVVDEVVDTEDIVVKPLSRQLKGIRCYAGATILGDGRVALILDVWSIAARAGVGAAERVVAEPDPSDPTEPGETRAASLLVTRLTGGRLLAIPLAGVTRLEDVPATRVEQVGAREALQYRDGILPIARLSELVTGASSNEGDTLKVVVYAERGRSVGLVVDEIVDVADDTTDLVTDIDGPGVAGTTVVQRQVMELLDVRAAILAADPHFYDAPADDRDPTTARA